MKLHVIRFANFQYRINFLNFGWAYSSRIETENKSCQQRKHGSGVSVVPCVLISDCKYWAIMDVMHLVLYPRHPLLMQPIPPWDLYYLAWVAHWDQVSWEFENVGQKRLTEAPCQPYMSQSEPNPICSVLPAEQKTIDFILFYLLLSKNLTDKTWKHINNLYNLS